ncbi:adenosine deaminase [Phenylobacterium sp. LjRoot225]|uniref:adenosine deaminase family protein n=1 Tax=Phenylobacterium sp. LjRoot225 TaxID=3342285 RepID=UPI003ECE180B
MRIFRLALLLLALALPTAGARAQTSPEQAAAARFDEVAGSPTRLRVFLQAMPKGGDLHNHLSGTPYAEDYLAWAADAGYCVDPAGPRLVPPPCAPGTDVRGLGERDPFAFGRLVDALSTRGLQAGVGRDDASGHTQFFTSFGKFGPVASARVPDLMAATRRLAAGDRVQYVELINNPNALNAYILAGPATPLDATGLAEAYRRELAGAGPVVAQGMSELDRHEADARLRLGCDKTPPGRASDSPACRVEVRYLAWVWRGLPPAQAFRSMVLAFLIADRDPRYVGVNIVQPEDAPISLRDYDLHMAMFRFLEAKYPKVRRTLHAGELARGLVPPADLRDHIRKAIEVGGAQRIGHGTDIAYEEGAAATLARMARDKIAVEINLTSNDVILGVKGAEHPLILYRRAGVPVVLSTDDEGILRTDLTNEYVRAAREHGLGYLELKGMARASLEYAFLPGASLWKDGEVGQPVDACAGPRGAPGCQALLRKSDKARLQADLEERFAAFENEVVGWVF